MGHTAEPSPVFRVASCRRQWASPITVAGPRGTFTRFPILSASAEHLTRAAGSVSAQPPVRTVSVPIQRGQAGGWLRIGSAAEKEGGNCHREKEAERRPSGVRAADVSPRLARALMGAALVRACGTLLPGSCPTDGVQREPRRIIANQRAAPTSSRSSLTSPPPAPESHRTPLRPPAAPTAGLA